MVSTSRKIEQAVRSLHQQAETVLDPEFLRALRICDATPVLDGPLTFPPPAPGPTAEWNRHWAAWLDHSFRDVTAPALLSALSHAAAGHYRELMAVDTGLAASLDGEMANRSALAGQKLLQRLAAAKGARWLDRLQAAVAAGSTPCHFAVAYACQGALFHLSPRAVLHTYAYWEWVAAAATGGYRSPDAVSTFQETSAPVLRRITERTLLSPTTCFDEPSRAAL